MKDSELFELVQKVDPMAVRLPKGIKAIADEIEAKHGAETAGLKKKLENMTRIAKFTHESCLLYDKDFPQFDDPKGEEYLPALLAKTREEVRIEMLTVEECNEMQLVAFAGGKSERDEEVAELTRKLAEHQAQMVAAAFMIDAGEGGRAFNILYKASAAEELTSLLTKEREKLVTEAQRVKDIVAAKYQERINNGTSDMTSNSDWMRLEGAVSVVEAIRSLK